MPARARIRGVAGPHRLGFDRVGASSSAWGSSDVRRSYSVPNPMGGPWIFARKAYEAVLLNVAASDGAELLSDHICREGDQKVTPPQREALPKESLTIAPSVSPLLRDVQVKREYRGRHSAVSCFRGTSHGAGWIAVGDAGQTVDPLSSSGIGVATANAVHGAESLLEMVAGDPAGALHTPGVRGHPS
jgi:flavin-dependent dehydrogenase